MHADALDAVQTALLTALLISAPILGAGLLIGLVISLVQAVTQIQEQTLTFVPKIAAMIIVAALLLSWLAVTMTDFATEMFTGPG